MRGLFLVRRNLNGYTMALIGKFYLNKYFVIKVLLRYLAKHPQYQEALAKPRGIVNNTGNVKLLESTDG
jgi:hypothetical protein